MYISTLCSCFLIGTLTCNTVFSETLLPGTSGQRPEQRKESQDKGHGKYYDGKLKITVNYSGPAVLDSVVKFAANISSVGKIVSNETLFIYQWENNATYHTLTSEANYTSSVRVKDFSSQGSMPTHPGVYQMKVIVYVKAWPFKLKKKVAEGSKIFRLTEFLNGKLTVKQKLSVKNEKLIFATRRPLNLSSIMTDIFDSTYNYAYIWYANDTFQAWNLNSSILYNGSHPGVLNITVKVKASCVEDPLTKEGVISKFITLKDEVNITSVQHQKEVHEGEPITVDIFYNGSNPTNFSWMLLNINGSYNSTILHGNERNFSFVLPGDQKDGTYYLNITAENIVSRVHTQTSFSVVHHKTPPPSTVIAIPVAFCTVGIIVTLAALAYSALRFRKKEHVTETADFNFHPHIKSRSRISIIIKNLLDLFLERQNFDSRSSLIEQPSSRMRTYGSLESPDEDDHLLSKSNLIL